MELFEYRIGLFAVLLFFCDIAIFSFIDTILENCRIKKWMMYGVYLFNTVFFTSILASGNRKMMFHYILIIVCLFMEILLLYKESLLRILFVTLTVTIHLMIIRAMFLSGLSIIFDISLSEANYDVFFVDSLNFTLALFGCMILGAIKFISAKSIKIINQHKEQLVFMTTWLVFANGYFLFNSMVFSEIDTIHFAKYNMIAVSLTIFFALYTVFLFTMKVGQLLNYKEKSDQLESIVEDEKQYKKSVIDQAIIGYEVNLSEDTIVYGFGKEYKQIRHKFKCYSEMVLTSIPHRVHKDDVEKVVEFMKVEHLLEGYYRGVVDQSIEYRVLPFGKEEYTWVKIFYNMYRSTTTNSIMAFSYIKDINVEKQYEIDIKHRSERDMLTGLYNHAMTKQLVNEFIESQDMPPYKGALLIIDVDNYKLINDNFGHSIGDEVLREIAKKLMSIFRCNKNTISHRVEDDIIGRIGGDEFMVFVKTLDTNRLKVRAQKICDLLKTTYTTPEGKEITISASVGITLVTGKEDNFKELYAKADIALYNTKRTGKDGYSFYNGETFQGYIGKR